MDQPAHALDMLQRFTGDKGFKNDFSSKSPWAHLQETRQFVEAKLEDTLRAVSATQA